MLNGPEVISVVGSSCVPCGFLGTVIEELAREHGDVSFGELNVDENRAIPMKFGITGIPTLLYFRDGKLVDKTIEALPREEIEDRIRKILA